MSHHHGMLNSGVTISVLGQYQFSLGSEIFVAIKNSGRIKDGWIFLKDRKRQEQSDFLSHNASVPPRLTNAYGGLLTLGNPERGFSMQDRAIFQTIVPMQDALSITVPRPTQKNQNRYCEDKSGQMSWRPFMSSLTRKSRKSFSRLDTLDLMLDYPDTSSLIGWMKPSVHNRDNLYCWPRVCMAIFWWGCRERERGGIQSGLGK